MIAPILEEIGAEYASKLTVCKLNIDENSETPPRYGIRGIPTLMLFENNQLKKRHIGAISASTLEELLEEVL